MKMHLRLFVLAAAALGSVGIANSASAVSLIGTGYFALRSNTPGVTWGMLTSTSTSFCFLTQVRHEDTDDFAEFATCKIIASGGNWWLGAELGSTADADIDCQATCYNN